MSSASPTCSAFSRAIAGIDRAPTRTSASASGSTLEWPGSVTSAHRRGRPRRAPRRELEHRRKVGRESPDQFEKHVRPLDAGRDLGEELLENCGCDLAVAREAMVRPPLARAAAVRARDRPGVSSAASSQSSAAARWRATGGRLRGGGIEFGGDLGVRALRGERRDGGPAPRRPSPRPRARGARHGASRPAPARSRSRRARDARSERASRRARRRLRERPPPAPRSTRSRSPYAAVTSSTVGRASAAAWSKTSPVWVGRRARRPPSSSLQALGNPQGPARRRPRVRADELAPQLECEKGITGRRLLHAGELWSGQLEPEPLLEQTMHRGRAERAEREPLAAARPGRSARARGHSRPRAPA